MTSFSSNQILTLLVGSFVNFFCSITVSLQAPFYPAEAEKKGATATEYGLVFGCYEFVAFITSPFFGEIIHKTGSKLMFGFGLMIGSVAVTAFGILESIGAASSTVASFSLVGCVFPDSLATVMATLETFYGCGFIVGPTIGGLLYEIGGFPLPFFVVGILSGILTISIFVFVPDVSKSSETKSSTGNLFNAIRTPSIAISAAGVIICSVSQSFYSATLEPHLRMFHISILLVSAIFTINGGTYAIAAPFVGRLVDKCLKPKYAFVISAILSIISFAIVGPLPFLPIPQTLTVCIIALFVQGLASAFGFVAGFVNGVQSAVAAGYPADISTYGLMSGIWNSSFCFGAFVGPSVSGFLYDMVGFQNSTIFVVVVNVIWLFILTIYLKTKKADTREEVAEKEELEKLI